MEVESSKFEQSNCSKEEIPQIVAECDNEDCRYYQGRFCDLQKKYIFISTPFSYTNHSSAVSLNYHHNWAYTTVVQVKNLVAQSRFQYMQLSLFN